MFKRLFSNDNQTSKCDQDTISILRLVRSENVGPKTFFELIRLFGNAQTALQHVGEFSLRGGRHKAVKIYSNVEAIEEIEALKKINASIITYNQLEYSRLLLQIPDPPPLLTYKGNIKLLNNRTLAVVGSRNASLNGISFTKNIVKKLIDNGVTIISGLARGIDTAAHQSSLPYTIAVIAGGINYIYPQENTDLYNKIAVEGVILAELPINSAPINKNFPQRNRIIAGMSYGTMIVEASLRSGSLITARLALEYNRELFAVPGFPYDSRYQGTNQLIKNGAHLVEDIDDILASLPVYDFSDSNHYYDQGNIKQYREFDSYKAITVTEKERKVVKDLLSSVPVEIEEIVKQTNLPVGVVNVIILELELAGKAVRFLDNKIAMIYQ